MATFSLQSAGGRGRALESISNPKEEYVTYVPYLSPAEDPLWGPQGALRLGVSEAEAVALYAFLLWLEEVGRFLSPHAREGWQGMPGAAQEPWLERARRGYRERVG